MSRTPVFYLGDQVRVRVNDFAGTGVIQQLEVRSEGATEPMVIVATTAGRKVRAYYHEIARLDDE